MTDKQKNISFSFEEVFPKNDACDRQDELFEYFEKLLSEKDAHAFEEHLKTCVACTTLLGALNEATHAAEATVIDAEKAEKIFEQTRTKLRQQLKVETGELTNIPIIAKHRTFSFAAYVNILLIGLVVALAFPSYKSVVLNNQIDGLKKELDAEKNRKIGSQEDIQGLKENYEKQIQALNDERTKLLEPGLSGSAVFAIRTERSGSIQNIDVLFNQNQKAFNLVFSVPVAEYKDYLVEIYDNGSPIWTDKIALSVPADSISGLISINLKQESLKAGNYRLRISGMQKNNPVQLDEFRLKVSAS